eukprot:m.32519 g.32519  ORF g.32519 m.32519 type:complete len:360 (+) comp10898_c1_seq1:279-1358(+)
MELVVRTLLGREVTVSALADSTIHSVLRRAAQQLGVRAEQLQLVDARTGAQLASGSCASLQLHSGCVLLACARMAAGIPLPRCPSSTTRLMLRSDPRRLLKRLRAMVSHRMAVRSALRAQPTGTLPPTNPAGTNSPAAANCPPPTMVRRIVALSPALGGSDRHGLRVRICRPTAGRLNTSSSSTSSSSSSSASSMSPAAVFAAAAAGANNNAPSTSTLPSSSSSFPSRSYFASHLPSSSSSHSHSRGSQPSTPPASPRAPRACAPTPPSDCSFWSSRAHAASSKHSGCVTRRALVPDEAMPSSATSASSSAESSQSSESFDDTQRKALAEKLAALKRQMLQRRVDRDQVFMRAQGLTSS